ncbi:chemotaxis protein CheW [Kangiella sp. TOML190]|uniref:chemotaxis protein CheW n=1 Tax=Kangiella sp. TOML190 TaxID=2931351 RepID=UPI0020401667|nr:chemotaxis protein CheW [Kangiella sp. TOML190]
MAKRSGNKSMDVVELLATIEQRSRTHKESLPEHDVRGTSFWSGVSFRLSGVDYLASLDEIHEIIPIPETTKVPGVKPWLKGVANLRGVLLTLVDLQEFLGRPSSRNVLNQRVLVLDQKGSYLGLIVDQVTGMQHFDKNDVLEKGLTADAAVAPYVVAAFEKEQEVWRVFGMNELAESAALHQIAV